MMLPKTENLGANKKSFVKAIDKTKQHSKI
jgi:hypothetical protein